MYPKCSLSDSNIYLQIVGLLSLVIIMIIAWFYYMRVCHTTIMEKYEPVIYKEAGQLESGNRSTYPRDKYPGAQMDLIGRNTPPRSTDKYELRDCKVYFTDDTGACDGKDDNGKTCSYNFDGWQEFATYTDKNGKIIEYPKKIYKQDATNTDALINSYFTSKCFKKFDNNGDGRPKPFEYTENNLVKYDSKGSMNNTEIDTNVFAGKKYTSMQFLNNSTPSDNFNNVLDSICSIRYNPLKELVGKIFFKFVLGANKKITQILKVRLNAEQTTFDILNNNAVLDFSFLGSHGLKFVSANSNKLEVFIASANIVKPVNVYKFSYVSYLCSLTKKAQITNFLKTSTQINISKFIEFGSKDTRATSANNPFTLDNLNILTASDYVAANTDYKVEMLKKLAEKRIERETKLNANSSAEKDRLDKKITDKDTEIFAADTARNSYSITEGTFTKVIDLTKTNTKIFKYNNGYNNTNLRKIPLSIPPGCEFIMIENTGDVCLIFKNKGDNQTSYNLSVPVSGYTCDILVIGGGGGGAGGGGGGGGYLYYTNINLTTGNYTVNVGKGGSGNNTQVTNGTQGANSSFIGGTISYTAYGGGGGNGHGALAPAHTTGQVGSYGGNGSDSTARQTYTSTQGNRGGSSIANYYGSPGGGGGANTVGGDPVYVAGLNAGSGMNSYNKGGQGGEGKPNSITGTTVYYAGGGNGGTNTDIETDISTQKPPIGGGGLGSRAPNGNGSNGTDGLGGGGGGGDFQRTTAGNGGAGIVIIRIKNIIPQPPDINLAIDNYYSIDSITDVSLAPYTVQTDIITAFVFLQKGYYRFRADLGTNTNGANPSIKYAHLMIYDENNFNRSTSTYKCVPVFKYNRQFKPAYLKQYVYIPISKFFKIAYFYISHNVSGDTNAPPFKMYYDYSTAPQQQIYPYDIESYPGVSSNTINNTDKYMIFNYGGSGTTKDYTLTTTEDLICDILIVGGGGAGGTGHGGGGGAGALIYLQSQNLGIGTYTIKVGNGGSAVSSRGITGNNGTHSSILLNGSTIYLAAGGGGGGGAIVSGANGGSGGGGDAAVGGSAVSTNIPSGTYGFAGGAGGFTGGESWSGGGGGGADAVGGNAVAAMNTFAGKGGAGREINITGTATYYAGGGGGGVISNPGGGYITNIGSGGIGGGGAGGKTSAGVPGSSNTGGGGGGGGFNRSTNIDYVGGAGGSGIIIIRYRLPSQRTAAIPLKDLNNNMNDDPDMYVSNNIINNIKTSMNDYLYYSETLYKDYKDKDTTTMDIFSIMNYTGNTKDNYIYLATYLNNKVDFFNTDKLLAEKSEFQRQLQTHNNKSSTTITGDEEIIKIDTLSNNISAINYNEKLPMTAPTLKDVSITDIFAESNNNLYLTYDTITNLNGLDLLNHKLTPAIYIEAIT